MCTRKIEIPIRFNQDNKNSWTYPEQLRSYYIKNETAYMMAKCGKCWECKQERARNWTFKLWLESKDYEKQCFLTLTIKNTKEEKGKNLNKTDLQNFIKRLRKNENLKDIKYFGAGEYGEKKGRAHYHLILFGYVPNDLRLDRRFYSKKGSAVYLSDKLTKIWGKGIVTVSPFHKDEIPYLTLYTNNNETINKKINWKQIKEKKEKLNQLYKKYGLASTVNNKTMKINNIKNLPKEQYKLYKKDYTEMMKTIKYNKETEFNIWSKNIGFNRFIKDKYYKYDLILDNYRVEIPKEYLRKIIENQEQYNEDVVNYTIYNILERKKYAEENYIDPKKDKEKLILELIKEKEQVNQNIDRIKLYKIHESVF